MTDDGSGDQGFAADRIDTSRPHPARIYDYLLGGWDNYEVDQLAGRRVIELAPDARVSVHANRDFLHRAVRGVVGDGIRQILDIGTGIPTSPNTHETAQAAAPDTRVVYVDNDPIVATHAGAKLTSADRTGFVLADVRDPGSVIDHPRVKQLIDFDRPVAVLLVAVLHFIEDSEDPAGIVRALAERLVPGSRLVLTHCTVDFHHGTGDATEVYNDATAHLAVRTYDEILPFFDGFELLDPGLVQVPLWHPDGPLPDADELRRIAVYGGVGVKE
ncbi:SAM-dependent methyltransferase [Streptomyces sp. SL13]|uniref:SAM-dependent methyltransferase n=1 Tax=Streptantibioticus silvisoli TaxID=2705255 RepID=A0AA90JW69_9ACTN|nr:SAM-dependent methyltransferase [Streptantibioticus silvisoli]MDI5963221.1 SAM-dependent methyltransferase [Streptantibioticus silvisoli]MDI5968666.1 SAM-dependent methyltransferase [Streptantibioticus silvisoli]